MLQSYPNERVFVEGSLNRHSRSKEQGVLFMHTVDQNAVVIFICVSFPFSPFRLYFGFFFLKEWTKYEEEQQFAKKNNKILMSF